MVLLSSPGDPRTREPSCVGNFRETSPGVLAKSLHVTFHVSLCTGALNTPLAETFAISYLATNPSVAVVSFARRFLLYSQGSRLKRGTSDTRYCIASIVNVGKRLCCV